jgi:hypothetical protein
MSPSAHRSALDRAAAAFVLAMLILGTIALFAGIPLAGLWALSKLTTSASGHFIAALLTIPVAVALFAPLLFRLNRLYLRIRAASLPDEAQDEWDQDWDPEAGEPPPIARGPLEPLLLIALGLALVAITGWFFFFAENPILW